MNRTFDRNFLLSLMLQYFNNGMKSMVSLACLDLFNAHYKLQPSETQYLNSMIVLPWTPKLVYGIFTDTFPIFGSRKRSYLIIMGFLQTICCFCLAAKEFENASSVAWLVTMVSLSGACMDVVVDGIMVG